jgi:hypothetical protein
MSKKKVINGLAPISSLMELRKLASEDERYEKLLHAAAENLGGSSGSSLDVSYRWLLSSASEVEGGEDTVVDEVNFCRDLI